MIMDVSLRFLYLIFDRLLSWLVLRGLDLAALGRAVRRSPPLG
jgi:hypothetical protein